MKKRILLLLMVLTCVAVRSQSQVTSEQAYVEDEKIKSLFSNIGQMGWWLSADFAWSKFDGRNGFLGGMSGGIIINHSYSIGGAGYWIIPSQNLSFSGINDTADVYLYGGYGGLKLEYRLNPTKLVSIAFPLLIGGGGAAYSTWGPKDWYNTHHDDLFGNSYIWDSYFVIEPGVTVGINILSFMRMDAGIGYRLTTGIDLPDVSRDMFNNFNATISMKFGIF
ncbi:MAG: hypothetical protein MUC78_04250 [Bacteroidales bacterium]|nr:hypothetical protein [Bacteroidales bacterium]